MNCYNNKDLNPNTCRFLKKCKVGFTRNKTYKCRKKLKDKKYSQLDLTMTSLKSKDVYKKSAEEELSPLKQEQKMKESVIKHSEKEPDKKRVFPLNSLDEYNKDKQYVIFEKGGTGIMLADTLYKDKKMVQLSKSMLKQHIQPPVNWYASEKYDGLRGIWTGKEMVARPSKKNGELKGKIFNYVPDWFLNMLPKGISLDGEIWLGRGRFQEISGLSNVKLSKKYTKEQLDDIWKEVKFMVFDIPHINDTYIERYEILKTVINDMRIQHGPSCPIVLTTTTIIRSHEHLAEIYKEYVTNGAEGLILREPSSYYEEKRSKLLLKMKINEDSEAIVLEHVLGDGKYSKLLGSLKCKLPNGNTFNIGTGFSDIIRNEYNNPDSKYYIPIGSTVNFSYMELTTKGIPRHPVYRGVRTDI